MADGCWIDVYESSACAGERRRVTGPVTLDAVVWSRYGDADVVCLRAGPRARARLVIDGVGALDVVPSSLVVDVRARRIVELRIELAPTGSSAAARRVRAACCAECAAAERDAVGRR